MAGCAERAETPRGDDSAALRRLRAAADSTPPGRYQLPLRGEGMPPLFISLPPNYTVRDLGDGELTDLMIVANDDPGFRDSAALTPGYIRVRVAPRSNDLQLEPVNGATERPVNIAGRQAVWKRIAMREEGTLFHYARLESSDFFSALSPELSKRAPRLVVEIGGADAARVDALITAVETLRFVP